MGNEYGECIQSTPLSLSLSIALSRTLSLSLSFTVRSILTTTTTAAGNGSRVASCLERLKRVLVVLVALRQFVKGMALAQQKKREGGEGGTVRGAVSLHTLFRNECLPLPVKCIRI